MKRFGIKAGLNGCGDVSTGACYACCVRALTKGRWMVRQILPLKYATHYFTNGNPSGVMGDANDQQFVNVSYWRMWMGRVFGHQTYRYEVKP